MINHLPAIFSLIVGAAGWFYIFYSRAASRLAGVESSAANLTRMRLRRVGGAAMILLAIAFYAGFVAIDQQRASAAAGFMLAVLALMTVIVALGLMDLRLTNRIRQAHGKQDHS